MPLSIPKISIGTKRKKSTFDYTRDVNTTSDFGFCQPTLCRPVLPDSHISLKTSFGVRLGVLPSPTFGRMKLYSFNTFVPIKSVFEGFDNMMSQEVINTSIRNYKPESADYVSNYDLLSFLYYPFVNTPLSEGDIIDKDLFSLAIPVYWKFDSDSQRYVNVYPQRNELVGDGAFYNGRTIPFIMPDNSDELDNMVQWFKFGSDRASNTFTSHSGWSEYLPYLTPSIDNADFIWKHLYKDEYVTLHLTHYGRRFLKILYGLGLDFGKYGNFELARLFAYYKAWFDRFNPQRDLQWLATRCYKFIHRYYDYGTDTHTWLFDRGHKDDFFEFIKELCYCTYTLPVDQFTVCTDSPVKQSINKSFSIPMNNRSSANVIMYNDTDSFSTDVESTGYTHAVIQNALSKILPFINKNTVIGRSIDKYMQTKFGQSLPDNYQFGSDDVDIHIDDVFSTSDTFDDSASTGSLLGEYAGKGIGGSQGSYSTFDTHEYGFIIQMFCIVPLGGYSQAADFGQIDFYDYYQTDFDSLGMEAVPNTAVFGSSYSPDNRTGRGNTFGFRPRYMGYKCSTNLRNGGFKFRGQRGFFDTYNLDRLFDDEDYKLVTYNAAGKAIQRIDRIDGLSMTVNESLRYIGQVKAYGNYDRIFVDSQGADDNFIVHMIQDLKVSSAMLPISQSFDTFDNYGGHEDDSSLSVEHS